jgi:hypothetical protein
MKGRKGQNTARYGKTTGQNRTGQNRQKQDKTVQAKPHQDKDNDNDKAGIDKKLQGVDKTRQDLTPVEELNEIAPNKISKSGQDFIKDK